MEMFTIRVAQSFDVEALDKKDAIRQALEAIREAAEDGSLLIDVE